MVQCSAGLNELDRVAGWLMKEAHYRLLLFEGEVGAGKTTLIKQVARQLGVDDAVSSPSFGLVHEYASPKGPVYHFDFYRLEDEHEALDIGLEEYLSSGHYCLVEWPEKICNLIPRESSRLRILPQGEQRLYQLSQPDNE